MSQSVSGSRVSYVTLVFVIEWLADWLHALQCTHTHTRSSSSTCELRCCTRAKQQAIRSWQPHLARRHATGLGYRRCVRLCQANENSHIADVVHKYAVRKQTQISRRRMQWRIVRCTLHTCQSFRRVHDSALGFMGIRRTRLPNKVCTNKSTESFWWNPSSAVGSLDAVSSRYGRKNHK